MSDSDALQLADWVLVNTRTPCSALKLQKLLFYCFGAVLAADEDVGEVAFQAWKHGPVCAAVYERFKDMGASPLPKPRYEPRFGFHVERPLLDALRVYERLSPWQLREESHTERPWKAAWDRAQGGGGRNIPTHELRSFFKEKFGGRVKPPANLTAGGFLDRIPVKTYASLGDLAQSLR